MQSRALPQAEFFDLQTGFVGQFIQKLVNYQITVACAFEEGRPFSDRFLEYTPMPAAEDGRWALSDAM